MHRINNHLWYIHGLYTGEYQKEVFGVVGSKIVKVSLGQLTKQQ